MSIDREKLLEELDKRRKLHIDDYYSFEVSPTAQIMVAYCLQELDEIVEMVENLSSVHGEWVDNGWNYICSHCNAKFDDDMLWITGDHWIPNYCPSCGADMRGEKND